MFGTLSGEDPLPLEPLKPKSVIENPPLLNKEKPCHSPIQFVALHSFLNGSFFLCPYPDVKNKDGQDI